MTGRPPLIPAAFSTAVTFVTRFEPSSLNLVWRASYDQDRASRGIHESALGSSYFLALSSLGISCLLNETRRRKIQEKHRPHHVLFGSKQVTLPAGTAVTVSLASAVGSKLSANGDHFSATVATPVQVDGKVVLPAGAEALGKVVHAVPQGRFKGAATLRLVLETVTVNNDSYDVKTSSVSRSLNGKGKRTATFIGGGAGGGALIGGLAGGGKGALISAFGAGAGTAPQGSAYTGDKEIILPAESALTFKLTEPVTIKM